MELLHKELVSKNSPTWVGFQHAVCTFICFIIFSLAISLTWPDFFGAYFSTNVQEIRDVIISTLIATSFSALLFFIVYKKKNQPQAILKRSLIWFVLIWLVIITYFFYTSPPLHYGKTPLDSLLEFLPQMAIMIIEFFIVTWIFLRPAFSQKDALEDMSQVSNLQNMNPKD